MSETYNREVEVEYRSNNSPITRLLIPDRIAANPNAAAESGEAFQAKLPGREYTTWVKAVGDDSGIVVVPAGFHYRVPTAILWENQGYKLAHYPDARTAILAFRRVYQVGPEHLQVEVERNGIRKWMFAREVPVSQGGSAVDTYNKQFVAHYCGKYIDSFVLVPDRVAENQREIAENGESFIARRPSRLFASGYAQTRVKIDAEATGLFTGGTGDLFVVDADE